MDARTHEIKQVDRLRRTSERESAGAGKKSWVRGGGRLLDPILFCPAALNLEPAGEASAARAWLARAPLVFAGLRAGMKGKGTRKNYQLRERSAGCFTN